MTTGGITPAGSLKLKSTDGLEDYSAQPVAHSERRDYLVFAMGVVLLLAIIFMGITATYQWLVFPLLCGCLATVTICRYLKESL
ncbi:hypothetical protein [Paenarthrobacter histidinolovorans]|uniref:hypothetical protein n=1 Tax=Paenarthrobacter histidinolovorans TaxID=43664 RepID=UPI001664659B|nr:hypothetical protein [Paenarthrobacter histidinolovorans]GGJ12405.1 hypothetical protein GCM10010052_07290 [Paenarthrobacter histidinolovorans]